MSLFADDPAFDLSQSSRRGRRSKAPARKKRARASEIASLTRREIEVLTLIAEGRSTVEIAYDLDITFKTADNHRCNLMRKLKVSRLALLVRVAIRCGLVEP